VSASLGESLTPLDWMTTLDDNSFGLISLPALPQAAILSEANTRWILIS
jgi:hypothetical protein